MATPSEYIGKAASYIGVSGTDNIFNTWYWGHRCYDPNIYPWCAVFQSYVGVHDLGMDFNPSASSAAVGNQGTRVADEDVQPGDWVLFNWDGRQTFGWTDHIGLVEWSDINGSGYFGTIEGNTGNSYGGEVARCTRYNWGSYATAFFRPNYDSSPAPKPDPQPVVIDDVVYAVSLDANGRIWLPEMIGLVDTGGSDDDFGGVSGAPIRYLAVKDVGKYRVYTEENGCLPWVNAYDKSDLEYGCAGDGSPIVGVEIPNPDIRYAVRNLNGDWNADMIGNYDTGGTSDPFAGTLQAPIDMIRIQKNG